MLEFLKIGLVYFLVILFCVSWVAIPWVFGALIFKWVLGL